MPRGTKENAEKDLISKKATAKKTVAKSLASTKDTLAKSKKNLTKKDDIKKVSNTKKKTTTKKTTSTKTTTRKITTSKSVSKKIVDKSNVDILEYYDLPYRYNQTVVKTLAQTPNTLFVYWDISDEDRKNFIDAYGENFFDDTTPVLIIHNKDKNYSFEIEINDFANSWYFNIEDTKNKYIVDLGRRPKNYNLSLPNNYLYISSSNIIESPNNHILFEKVQKYITFRNVKNNKTYLKKVTNLNFMKYVGKISDLYNKFYKNENILDLKNPSSSNPTSTFK